MNNITVNPFMPSFGRIPKMVIDQQATMDNYISHLLIKDAKYQTSLISGVRGSGKTVFLLKVKHNYEKNDNHFFIRLNLGQGNLLQQLLSNLQRLSGLSLQDILQSIQEVNILGNGISFQNSQNGQTDYIDYFSALKLILEKFQKKNISILVGIDEIEVSDDTRSFASVYQSLIGEDLDISLIMTGLPNKISELQREDTLTFLLRSNHITLKPLDYDSVYSNYEIAFSKGKKIIEPILLERLSRSVHGYAYAFQAIGYYTWEQSKNIIDNQTINEALSLAKKDLFHNSYEKLYTEISENDRILLKAVASYKNEQVPVKELLEKLKWKKSYLSVYRARLIKDQLIVVPSRGYLSLTLPFFKEFIDWYEDRHLI